MLELLPAIESYMAMGQSNLRYLWNRDDYPILKAFGMFTGVPGF